MRMDLRCEPGPDGPEVWACADGAAFARATHRDDGYYVDRDLVPPELEPAIQELEYEVGARVLEVGESVGCDVRRPGDAQVCAARRGDPPHRPGPRTATVGNIIITVSGSESDA